MVQPISIIIQYASTQLCINAYECMRVVFDNNCHAYIATDCQQQRTTYVLMMNRETL